MFQHTPHCTRGRRNFCARVPAAPDKAADRGAVRNAQCIHNAVKETLQVLQCGIPAEIAEQLVYFMQ